MAPSAVSGKGRVPSKTHDRLGHDRTSRISGPEEQDVVVSLHLVPSMAAGWRTAIFFSQRLHRPHKRAHELAIYQRRNRIHVDVLAGQKLAGILNSINPGWFNLNFLEARSRKLAAVIILFQRAGNAAHPKQHALANLIGY